MISGELYESLFNFAASTHLLAAALFLLVTIILVSPNTENFIGKKFYLVSLAIGISQIAQYLFKSTWINFDWISLSETLVLIAISLTLIQLINPRHNSPLRRWGFGCLCAVLLGEAIWISGKYFFASSQLVHLGRLSALLFILLLSEQVFRNAKSNSRVLIRPFFFAIWLWIAAQIYNTGFFILFAKPNSNLHLFEGYYEILIATVLLVGSSRSTHEQSFSMSRQSVFYGTSLSISSIALIFMALTSYMTDVTEAGWANSVQLFIFLSTFSAVIFLIASSKARSNLRVLINKNLFGNKYDYRDIWLTMINRLSTSGQTEGFYDISLNSLIEIFKAQGGAIWIEHHGTEFSLVSRLNLNNLPEQAQSVPLDAPFIRPMLSDDWIYTLAGTNDKTATENNDLLPSWTREIANAWIVGPLIISGEIVGLFLLTRSNSNTSMIWEDIDVARSAGRQIASYIARQQSAEKLAESKQFDTYNQLTAFIMHDLKNLIAQQALVVKNADRHKDNPAFVEDMIHTIDNSVQRMNTLLLKLRRSEDSKQARSADLKRLLLEAIRKSTDRQPIPTLRNQDIHLSVRADIDQLTMVLTHLIRNAQDATHNDGFIDIDVTVNESDKVLVSIEDNGCGMSRDFLKNHLFKPFVSTKSGMGMGIGAYQARDFVRSMGGDITVESEENKGTTINISLPLA